VQPYRETPKLATFPRTSDDGRPRERDWKTWPPANCVVFFTRNENRTRLPRDRRADFSRLRDAPRGSSNGRVRSDPTLLSAGFDRKCLARSSRLVKPPPFSSSSRRKLTLPRLPLGAVRLSRVNISSLNFVSRERPCCRYLCSVDVELAVFTFRVES